MHETHNTSHSGPSDSQGTDGSLDMLGLHISQRHILTTHRKLCYITTKDGAKRRFLTLTLTAFTKSSMLPAWSPCTQGMWQPVHGVELMHMRTEVAASMHRDSGLLLTTHDTENPTDTHASHHLNTASHIFFFFFLNSITSIFCCTLCKDLMPKKGHFARQN